MHEALDIVKGAVADKDLVPVLTHFHIYNGRIQGANGNLAIDCSCLPLFKKSTLTVPADKFIAAVASIEKPKFKRVQETLIITGDSATIKLPLSTGDLFPITQAAPKYTRLTDKIHGLLESLRPFVSTDSSRQSLLSIAIRDGYAYAASNVTVARIKTKLQDMVIPVYMVDELLRIDQEPTGFYLDERSLYFKLSSDAWIKSSLIRDKWPNIEALFEGRGRMKKVPSEFMTDIIERLVPFCIDPNFPAIIFSATGIETVDGVTHGKDTALALPQGNWNAKNMLLVLTEATHIDLGSWPAPCRWKGDNIEGVTMGLRE